MNDVGKTPTEVGNPSRQARAVADWWRGILPSFDEDGSPSGRGDRAAAARLRRADAAGIVGEAALADLFGRMWEAEDVVPWMVERTVLVAMVVAHVRSIHQGGERKRFARMIGFKSYDDAGALVGETRFRSLLTARGGPDLTRSFRRVVGMVEAPIDVLDLAETLIRWDEPSGRTRARFALDYYSTFPFAKGA